MQTVKTLASLHIYAATEPKLFSNKHTGYCRINVQKEMLKVDTYQ